MALAVTLNFTVLDAKGKSSVTKIRVPTGFTFAQYIAFGQAMGQLVANLQDGSITEVSVSVPIDLSTASLKAVATGIADIAKKALFQAQSIVAGLFAKYFLPTYDEANTLANSDQLDVADAQVAAFITLIEDGVNVSGTIVTPRDLRGNPLDEVLVSREIFRKFG